MNRYLSRVCTPLLLCRRFNNDVFDENNKHLLQRIIAMSRLPVSRERLEVIFIVIIINQSLCMII